MIFSQIQHSLFRSARGVTRRRSLVEEPVVQQPNGFQQPVDALQLFTIDLQKQLGQKESKKGDFDTIVAKNCEHNDQSQEQDEKEFVWKGTSSHAVFNLVISLSHADFNLVISSSHADSIAQC